MKILHITEYFPHSADCEVRGGIEARAFYISRELARLGHDITVLCARMPDEPVEHEIAGITVRRCGPVRPYTQAGSKLARLEFMRSSVQIGKSLGVDLVDGQNYLAYVSAIHIARAADIPRVATYHDVWLGEWRKNMGFSAGLMGEVLERYVLAHRWDHFIVNSGATRRKLAAVAKGSPRIDVVYNGISLAEYAGARPPRYSRPTICYVGRLVRYKRVHDLLHALLVVRAQIPEVVLEIVGSGPDRDAVEALVRELGLERNVNMRGFVEKHRDVLDVMARSHVVCLPSEVEGFGMVVVEAMACGTPVVASALEPIREITKEGQGGSLFPVGDVPELARQLLALLGDPALHARCVAEGRAIASGFDWKSLGQQTENIYRGLLS
jgi:glycosyltransferase involved in cell wall biosynthesis